MSFNSNPSKKKLFYQCKDCRENFTAYGTLSVATHHIKVHGGEQFKCNVCGFVISNYNITNIEKHKRTPTGEKLYNCDKCGEQKTSKDGLRKHQLNHLIVDGPTSEEEQAILKERAFSCNQCEDICVENCSKRILKNSQTKMRLWSYISRF